LLLLLFLEILFLCINIENLQLEKAKKKQIGRSDKKIAAMKKEGRREATSYENLKVSSLEDHPSIRF